MIKTKVIGNVNGDIEYEIKITHKNKKNSVCYAIINSDNNRNYIYYISSREKGDMKKMINYLVEKTKYKEIWFISPLNSFDKKILSKVFDINVEKKGIKEVLNDYYKANTKFRGKKCICYVTWWEK